MKTVAVGSKKRVVVSTKATKKMGTNIRKKRGWVFKIGPDAFENPSSALLDVVKFNQTGKRVYIDIFV